MDEFKIQLLAIRPLFIKDYQKTINHCLSKKNIAENLILNKRNHQKKK